MFESFGLWLNSIVLTLVGGNQEAVGFVTAAILATLMVTIKNLPMKIYKVIQVRIVRKIVMDDAEPVDRLYKERFFRFLTKNMDKIYGSTFKPFNLNGSRTMGITTGKYVLFYGYRLWFISISREYRDGGNRSSGLVEKISVSTITTNRNVISDFIHNNFASDKEKKCRVRKGRESGSIAEFDSRTKSFTDNIIATEFVEENFLQNVDRFLNNEEWYKNKGLPYRKTYLLEGPPGTGKTSLVRYLGAKEKIDIVTTSLKDPDCENVILNANRWSKTIVLIEDVDRSGDVNDDSENIEESTNRDLGAILNYFDGIAPIDNAIIIFTTNHIAKLDKAFLRKGRIDKVVHVGYLKAKDINAFIVRNYNRDLSNEEMDFIDNINGDIRACDVFSSWKEHPEDLEKFLEDLKQEVENFIN